MARREHRNSFQNNTIVQSQIASGHVIPVDAGCDEDLDIPHNFVFPSTTSGTGRSTESIFLKNTHCDDTKHNSPINLAATNAHASSPEVSEEGKEGISYGENSNT